MSQRTRTGAKGFGGGLQNRKKKCVNPIFEQWLMEWKEEAIEKNSKMQYVYAKALKSLQLYPLPLATGKECILLKNFGHTLCKMIDLRMSKENITSSEGSQSSSQGLGSIIDLGTPPQKNPSKSPAKKAAKKTNKNFVPTYRSGSYAILVTIFKKEEIPGYRGYMLKSEIQQEAQEFCESSMSKGENGSKYTGWSSMGTLVNKGLILKQGNPAKYTLTIEGRELAAKLLNADNHGQPLAGVGDSQEVEDLDSQESELSQPVRFQCTYLEPGQFEIVLLVDTGETNKQSRKEELIGELRKNGVSLEVVRLSIGDFVWVCRKKTSSVSANRNRLTISKANDMVLPYIVERKRADDLASSIKDGRFHEQKHRLMQSGLQPIYLIESQRDYGDWGLAEGALSQAIANTQIINDFLLHETKSLKETCGYLTQMTRHLNAMYINKRLTNCKKEEYSNLKNSTANETFLLDFNDFNEFGTKTKNWTVTETFARMLMRIRGLSVERAYAIVQKYPTMRSLMREYEQCEDDKERISIIANIRYGNFGKTIGPSLARTLVKLYTSDDLP